MHHHCNQTNNQYYIVIVLVHNTQTNNSTIESADVYFSFQSPLPEWSVGMDAVTIVVLVQDSFGSRFVGNISSFLQFEVLMIVSAPCLLNSTSSLSRPLMHNGSAVFNNVRFEGTAVLGWCNDSSRLCV